MEIYYLENGKYALAESCIADDDEKSGSYNFKTSLMLRCFPVTMTLEDIITM